MNATKPQPRGNVLTFRARTDSVDAVVWLPDGKHIASASGDGSVQVWQAGSINLTSPQTASYTL